MSDTATQQHAHSVLVVDDDRGIRLLLRRVLERAGYVVEEAEDGAQALSVYERVRPDIVLLDVMMPVIDGFAACARLRTLPGGDRTPVLMITALDDNESVDRAFEAGASDYITKPVHLAVVRQRVSRLLQARQVEEAISQAKKEWEATFDAVSDLIILTDMESKIIRCNRSAIRHLQTTYNELIGRHINEVFFGDPEPGKPLGLVSRPCPLPRGETQFPLLDGWFEVSHYPVHLEDSLHGIVYIIKDITERKQMQERLLAAQKLADLGTLAAGIAHEINSPLQVITGMSQSLLARLDKDALETDRLHRDIESIHRNGWRCAEIVRSLLIYARASAQQIEPNDLNELVHDTLLLIEHQLRSWSNITIVTDLAADLPTLPCDRNQITQVCVNLLTNARDAMPGGGEITIRTGYDPQSRRLYLQVADTGPGIPESIRGRIFDPFFTTKPVGQGTGLGLSIVSGIVRAYGGEIEVSSTPGHGATFTLFFPKDATDAVNLLPPAAGGRFDDAVLDRRPPRGDRFDSTAAK